MVMVLQKSLWCKKIYVIISILIISHLLIDGFLLSPPKISLSISMASASILSHNKHRHYSKNRIRFAQVLDGDIHTRESVDVYPAILPELSQEHKDEHYMTIALRLAEEAFEADEIPVGAVLVSGDDQILATGRNRVEEIKDASAHAEMECLRQASRLNRQEHWRMLNCTLYVTLEPCLMCLGAIQNFRVKRLVYGAKSHLLGAIESYIQVLDNDRRHPFHQVQVQGGTMAEASSILMKEFFTRRRRRQEKRVCE